MIYLHSEKTNTTAIKQSANTLVMMPKAANEPCPTGYLDGKSGWWVSFRQRRQPMQTVYEMHRADTPTELMMLNAMVLPMLIRDIRAVNMKEKMMALTGSWKWPFT